MSYAKMMKWHRRHPKGTRQPVIMSTGTGFWPAKAWLEDVFWPYLAECKRLGVEPVACEAFYKITLATRHDPRTPEAYALMTKNGTMQ